ncbi:MAG TPA: pyrroloquinoline quinone biosynthesis protein PqqB [Candidatus Acidoferrales bacterium]|jgi:pyrroloquinoline quinone biosynthesis protein B|nr:pyrroloquinoline quinone biosynthesis protein PqqB [Candidatus Acidoferrales bacterium]
MRVKVLGSAAGGGFPQWNCGCANCLRVRQGSESSIPRTQAQAAVTADDESWFLLNASPDLRQQILATPEFSPAAGERGSPIVGVVLTSADVDAVVGLFHLREFHPLRVYCTSGVRRILTETNSMFRVLERSKPPVEWCDIPPGTRTPLGESGASCTAVSLDGTYPDYVDESLRRTLPIGEAAVGLLIECGEKKAFFAPGLPGKGSAWKSKVAESDLLLLDGTFWSDDELVAIRGGGKGAREMGHPPLSGTGGLLEELRHETRPRKVAIHINNTNPILDENSAEHRLMREAGWEIARDGMEFVL